jgi:predicted nucleic acid-binding protein
VKASLLDSSFLIDLLNEIADDCEGPAFAWLKRNAKMRLWISPVTVAEVLEGANVVEAVKTYLARFAWQGIHRMHAESVAARQRRSSRRLGENDAWQCALAERMNATLVAHDAAFRILGSRYEDYRRSGS